MMVPSAPPPLRRLPAVPLLAALVAALIGASACGGSSLTRVTRAVPPPPAVDSAEPPPLAPFTLAAGDLLAIQFPLRPDLSQELLVRSDGKVTLPFVGTIDAAGRTPEDVEAEARRLYAERAYTPLRAAGEERRYRIGVDDELSVRFRRAPELNASVRVRPDGRISLALVRSVPVEGLTPEELEAELTRRYAAHLEAPELVVVLDQPASARTHADAGAGRPPLRDVDSASISLRSMAPRQVFVVGEVQDAGFVTHQPTLTVLQSVVAAGGPLRTAKLDNVVVLRKGVAEPTVTVVNLAADLRGRAANDFALQPFDIVIVPKTRIGRVNDFLDQYLYQLVPATRNVNFTYFYDVSGRPRP